MSATMKDLHAVGLNPFAVQLLAESMLKSAYVKHCGTQPLTFNYPVQREDCAGWLGVRITIEAVSVDGQPQAEAVPDWIKYDTLNDVLTIRGKRYAAGMFGEEGFLAPVGTLLRVEAGSTDVVTLTTVTQTEAVPAVTDAMALAFHRALTDGAIGQSEVEEIKIGLRAAIAAQKASAT